MAIIYLTKEAPYQPNRIVMILLLLNLPALSRMILRRPDPETQMPDEPDDKRSTKETAQLARNVMKRMLATPPTPHADAKGRGKVKPRGRQRSARKA